MKNTNRKLPVMQFIVNLLQIYLCIRLPVSGRVFHCRFCNRISSFVHPSVYTSHYSERWTINTWMLNSYPQTTTPRIYHGLLTLSTYSFLQIFKNPFFYSIKVWRALFYTELILYNEFNFGTPLLTLFVKVILNFSWYDYFLTSNLHFHFVETFKC